MYTQTVRRQRVNFMSGQHQVAHFFRGMDTPASDVIQVSKLIYDVRLRPGVVKFGSTCCCYLLLFVVICCYLLLFVVIVVIVVLLCILINTRLLCFAGYLQAGQVQWEVPQSLCYLGRL